MNDETRQSQILCACLLLCFSDSLGFLFTFVVNFIIHFLVILWIWPRWRRLLKVGASIAQRQRKNAKATAEIWRIVPWTPVWKQATRLEKPYKALTLQRSFAKIRPRRGRASHRSFASCMPRNGRRHCRSNRCRFAHALHSYREVCLPEVLQFLEGRWTKVVPRSDPKRIPHSDPNSESWHM